jgi:hypothetical protein
METEFTTEVAEPTDGGQVASDETTAFEQQEIDYLNWDEYGDKHVKVTVDGEEVDVPLKEALSGYQRQSDYTRKTQELAEERRQVQFARAIQQALDNDPAATVELLKSHYGLTDKQASDLVGEDDDLFADPVEQQYRQLESRIRSFEEQQAYQELERTIQSLQSKYEDFDANEVVSAALANGTSDLESVYKQMAFDKLYQQKQIQQQIATQQSAKEKQIVDSKRQAGAVVSSGSSAANTSNGTGQISSLRDAFSAAKQQLGISSI